MLEWFQFIPLTLGKISVTNQSKLSVNLIIIEILTAQVEAQ